jgi:hypothetical protein
VGRIFTDQNLKLEFPCAKWKLRDIRPSQRLWTLQMKTTKCLAQCLSIISLFSDDAASSEMTISE